MPTRSNIRVSTTLTPRLDHPDPERGARQDGYFDVGRVGGLEAEKGFLHHGSAPASRGEGPGPG